MIKFNGKSMNASQLARAISADIEKQLVAKAKQAASRHGGVTVRVARKADGTIRSLELQGSPDALKAAQSTFKR